MLENNCTIYFKMQATKCLVFVFLLVLWSENAQFKKIPEVNNFEIFFDNTLESKALVHGNDKRNIKDVWNKIKNSITNAWNALKVFAKSTKQKIKNMNEKMKARAEEIIKSFENQMDQLKEKINEVIKNVFDETEIVKKCLIKERASLENVAKEILQHLSVCIAGSLKNLTLLIDNRIRTLNDTDFYVDLENKFEECNKDAENVEDCLNQVRKDIFNDMDQVEADITKNKMESRNMADDVLEKLIICSIDAVIETSSSITREVLQIANCIMDS